MDKIHNLVAGVTGSEKIGFLDTEPTSLYVAAGAIAFNPIFWNIVARQEYKNHVLTKIFGSPRIGCCFLALVIFSIGLIRDHLYNAAIGDQPFYPPLHQPLIGAILFGTGMMFVVTSMYVLGFFGTYLGDYFGILMDAKVESFPFNVTGSPMYWGSTLSFLGTALYKGRVAGILLTLEVFVVYYIALRYEDPFTAQIYAQREKQRAAGIISKEEEKKRT